jgi:hypothetical protein
MEAKAVSNRVDSYLRSRTVPRWVVNYQYRAFA